MSFVDRALHQVRTVGRLALTEPAQDVRHAARSLRRSPGFAIVAVLTLAIGIGTTTAVLSIVDHVLLHSLPFRDPDRLVMLLERDAHGAFRTPSYPTVEDWRRDPGIRQAFEGVSFQRGDGVILTRGDEVDRVGAAFVGPEFFPLLGAGAELGRVLLDDDQHDGSPPVVVLSHALWQTRFGGAPSVIGTRISLDSIPTTVVGVLPAGASYPTFAQVVLPVSQYRRQAELTRRGLHADSRTVGRLRPGVDSARAAMLMRTVGVRLAQAYPSEQAGWTGAALPLQADIIGDVRPMLLTLAGAAVAVLLLACSNVANLLLARVSARTRELAVRSALGASRGRVIRQLLTESASLVLVGGGAGTAAAVVAVGLARKLPPDRLPRVEELSVDARVLALAAGASLLTALLCGLWPAIRATRITSGEALRSGAGGSGGFRADARVRRALVSGQFALALVLLVGAGLLLQSFRRVAAVPLGFDSHHLVSASVFPSRAQYGEPRQAAALYDRLLASIRAVPGVTDVALIQHFPLGNAAITTSIAVDGRSGIDSSSNQIFYRTVSASYLPTMKMSLVSGRWFTEDDMRSPGGVFVINETLAKRYWPGESAVGKRITVHRSSQARSDFGAALPGTIVGVIADVHQVAQDALPEPEVYVPYTLEVWPWASLVARTRDDASVLPALRRAVRAVDPMLMRAADSQADGFVRTDDLLSRSLEPRRLALTLIGVFAGSALVLAAIGMYGVVAFSITERTRELGIRKALGATDRMIAALVLRESFVLTAAGVVVGCLGAWSGARLIRGLLFDTGPADPLAYLVTIALLVVVTVVATFVPARRATRLDPTIAMRGE